MYLVPEPPAQELCSPWRPPVRRLAAAPCRPHLGSCRRSFPSSFGRSRPEPSALDAVGRSGLWAGCLALGVQCWQAWATPRRRCCQQPLLGVHYLAARGGEEGSLLRPSLIFGYDADSTVSEEEPAALDGSAAAAHAPGAQEREALSYGSFTGRPCAEQPEVIAKLHRILSQGLEGKTRACASLNGATGTGKTLVGAKLLHELGRPVLWLCHTKDLAKQTVQALRRYLCDADVELLTSMFKDYRPSRFVHRGKGRAPVYKNPWGMVDEEAAGSRVRALASIKRGKLTIIVASCAAVYPCRHPKWPSDLTGDHEVKRSLLEGISKEIADLMEMRTKLKKLEEPEQRRALSTRRWQVRMQLLRVLSQDRAQILKTGRCPELFAKYAAFIPEGLCVTPVDLMRQEYGQDWLLVVDESHATISHLKTPSKHWQCANRKLVDFGCRLESTGHFGPLSVEEFFGRRPNAVLLISATPDHEKMNALDLKPEEVTMVQRPTHILDPVVSFVRCSEENRHTFYKGFFDAIYSEREAGSQVLLACFTQWEAEVLAHVINKGRLRAAHVHGDMGPEDRAAVLEAFRAGETDVLVGANLFREGLDFPRVGLIYVFDADHNGFMRNARSLTQFVGRVARNVHGRAILVHRRERPTEPMEQCKEKSEENRRQQLLYNELHGYTPKPLLTAPLEPLGRRETSLPTHGAEAVEAKIRKPTEAELQEAPLRTVEGIGKIRAKRLLEHFEDDPRLVAQAAEKGGRCPVRRIGSTLWLRLKDQSSAIYRGIDAVAFEKMLHKALVEHMEGLDLHTDAALEEPEEEKEDEEEEEKNEDNEELAWVDERRTERVLA